MNCKSINSLHDFEFHDAFWELEACDAGSLSVCVRHLSIHENAPQNDSDCDMEIQLSKMTFEGFRVSSYSPGVVWERDASGKSYQVERMAVIEGEKALNAFLKELMHGLNLIRFRKENDACWSLIGCGAEPYFEVQLSFENVIVEWDAFAGPAWYVLRARGIQA